MADMTLTKPAAGAQDIVNAQPDARLLLDFPAGDATLERSGDDLIFHFDDGSNLVLRDFYTSYTRENMPDFVIDGTPVSGQEFFAALNNEDLMPAAGRQQRGRRAFPRIRRRSPASGRGQTRRP